VLVVSGSDVVVSGIDVVVSGIDVVVSGTDVVVSGLDVVVVLVVGGTMAPVSDHVCMSVNVSTSPALR
jgi:hypothetical protein